MCCLIAAMLGVGPRLAIVVWWLFNSDRWSAAFDSFWAPFIGFLLVPWTTLVFVIVAPAGTIRGFDWIFLAVALFADLTTYGGGVRDRARR